MVKLKLFKFSPGPGHSIKSVAVTKTVRECDAQRVVQEFYDNPYTGVHVDTLKKYPVKH